MGTSTNGQLCFGIAFDEEFEFPWPSHADMTWQEEMEHWWMYVVHEMKHSVELFDRLTGAQLLQDHSDEESEAYFREEEEFLAAHPLPVELVTHCSEDCPTYILAVPGTLRENRRGDPTVFDPAALTVTPDQVAALLKFCSDHGIEVPSAPAWYLTSMLAFICATNSSHFFSLAARHSLYAASLSHAAQNNQAERVRQVPAEAPGRL